MATIKFLSELLKSGQFFDSPICLSVLVILLLISLACNVLCLNVGMKFYDQMEVIPIFQTFRQLSWILSGLIILDEIVDYQTYQLAIIFVGALFCLAGIHILSMKKDALKEE